MALGEERRWPPGPRGHRLTGNTRAYEADRIGFLRRSHREYGDVFSCDEHTLFVIDPELAHEALIRTGDTFVTELAPFDMRRDTDRAAEHATSWMPERRSAWPGLNRTAAAMTDEPTVAILDAVITDGAGQEVDVLTTMRTLTARTIAEYCFGADHAGVASCSTRPSVPRRPSRRRPASSTRDCRFPAIAATSAPTANSLRTAR